MHKKKYHSKKLRNAVIALSLASIFSPIHPTLFYAPSILAQESSETTTSEDTTVEETTKKVELTGNQSLTEEDLNAIKEVYDLIKEDYIEDIDKKTLIEGALKGMVNATGDQFSEFYNIVESSDFEDSLSDSFEGIGVQFSLQSGKVVVISPIDDTPAQQAGIVANDIFLEADGTALDGLSTNEIVNLIRGEKGSKVKLKVQRGDKVFDVEITRDTIPVETVKANLDEHDNTIAKIQITQFGKGTYKELVSAINEMRQNGATAFVFDLRSNPGGLLDQALKISNMFLKDQDIIVQTAEKGQSPSDHKANAAQLGDFKVTEPYVVLIDNGSASASEILAAAIQQNTDNLILGEKSYGKGSVQMVVTQNDYGELKLTIAKWLTPDGTWIHQKGIEPDQEIKADPVTTALALSAETELKLEQGGDAIENLAVMLEALGYELTSTNYFNDAMKKAVETFQKEHNLEVTGIVSGDTATTLNDAIRQYIEEHDTQYDNAVKILKGES